MKPLQTPGPLQRLILEALAIAMADGSQSLSTQNLADTLNRKEGSLLGALSGMRRCGKRYWVKELEGFGARHDRRRWAITANGMAALLKLTREA